MEVFVGKRTWKSSPVQEALDTPETLIVKEGVPVHASHHGGCESVFHAHSCVSRSESTTGRMGPAGTLDNGVPKDPRARAGQTMKVPALEKLLPSSLSAVSQYW